MQSVAVRLVVEREREIEAFVPEEYWTLDADLAAQLPPEFRARLAKVDGQKADLEGRGPDPAGWSPSWTGRATSSAPVDRKERRRNPPPPFITSKLQQEAANRLRFTPKKTMTLAQRLYEGVELGDEGAVGLITYMRTDSVRLSTEAVDAARGYIGERFGEDHLPAEPNVYKTKAKQAQDAHEAIRPTSLEWTPEPVAPFFEQMGERDMYRLYELIWNRFVACQMVPAVYDQTTADIAAGAGRSSAPPAPSSSSPATWPSTARSRRRRRPGPRRRRRATPPTARREAGEGRGPAAAAAGGRDGAPPHRSSCRSSTSPSRRRASPSRRW